uniref:RNA-directed DNA polymerase n=1 Tax=Sarcophilus harrisii TaxID=9305 RepID=A0A7N4NFB9_SARHA
MHTHKKLRILELIQLFHVDKDKNVKKIVQTNRNHIIISIGAEKAFDKIQHPILSNALQSIGINGVFLKMISSIYLKLSPSIICNEFKLDTLPLRSGMKQGCLLSPLLFNIVLEMLALMMRRKLT